MTQYEPDWKECMTCCCKRPIDKLMQVGERWGIKEKYPLYRCKEDDSVTKSCLAVLLEGPINGTQTDR